MQVIYYLRTKYEIIRRSSIVKVVASASTTVKKFFRVYFFIAPSESHITYRVYEASVTYCTETGEPRISTQKFQLVIDENKLVEDSSNESEDKDVNIAYGYQIMSP